MHGRLAIVCSKVDPASMNIRDKLLKNMNFKRVEEKLWGNDVYVLDDVLLVTVNQELIYADGVDEILKVKGIIFASRHAAESGMPAFLAHTPGNWTDETLYGGRPRSICVAMPIQLMAIVRDLNRFREEEGLIDWRCGLEVTHHGPYIEHVPAMFVELGSTHNEWRNSKAAELVARAIVNVLEVTEEVPVAVGFGGPHYAPQFNKVLLNEKLAISHIVPKYAFPKVTNRELMLAVERSTVKPSFALIDWKGLKSDERQLVLKFCNEIGLRIRKL